MSIARNLAALLDSAGAVAAEALTNATGAVDFVALGALSKGDTVVLEDDGTVKAVGIDASGAMSTKTFGSTYQTLTNLNTQRQNRAIAADPNTAGRFVIIGADSTLSYPDHNVGTIVVGTAIGDAVVFGTKQVFEPGYNVTNVSITFDPDTPNTFVIGYTAETTSPYTSGSYLRTGSIDGTVITLGPKLTLADSPRLQEHVIAFDPHHVGQFAFLTNIYSSVTGNDQMQAYIGTVTAGVISLAAPVIFIGQKWGWDIAFDPITPDRLVLIWRLNANPAKGQAAVGTLDGTTLTLNNTYVYETGFVNRAKIAFLPHTNANGDTGRFVISYHAQSGDNPGVVVYGGTINGTGINFSQKEVMSNEGGSTILLSSIAFNPARPNEVMSVFYFSDSPGRTVFLTTEISDDWAPRGTHTTEAYRLVGSPVSESSHKTAFLYDPDDTGRFVSFAQQGYDGGSIVLVGTASGTNLTNSNFVGTSTGNYEDAASIAAITVQGGVSTEHSELAIGEIYYVQVDGSLSTAVGELSVIAGKALSDSTLLLKGI